MDIYSFKTHVNEYGKVLLIHTNTIVKEFLSHLTFGPILKRKHVSLFNIKFFPYGLLEPQSKLLVNTSRLL